MGNQSVSSPRTTTKEIATDKSSGNSDLEEPLAIRPTSETGMYPCMFSHFHLVFLPVDHRLRLCEMDSKSS